MRIRSMIALVVFAISLAISCSSPSVPSGGTSGENNNQLQTSQLSSAPATADHEQISSFGDNPGNLKMYVHVPQGMSTESRPLVVAMHGCDAFGMAPAKSFADATGWSDLADQKKFFVVYPEQQTKNDANKTGNPYKCFNWAGFYGAKINPGEGENKSIRNMIQYMIDNYNIDPKRIFVTGLSAGAGMSAVMMASYPDLIAAGAPMSGVAYHCANYGFSGEDSNVEKAAYACMGVTEGGMQPRTGGPNCESGEACMDMDKKHTPAEWASFVRNALPGYSGKYPKVMIWQGFKDQYVDDDNMTEMREQWTAVHGIDETHDNTDTTLNSNGGHVYKEYHDNSGNLIVATVEVTTMKHGVAVDPGSGAEQGGQIGAWYLDANIWAPFHAYQFFMKVTEDNGNPVVTIESPTQGQTIAPGSITIQLKAVDDKGVSKVEVFEGSVKLGDAALVSGTSTNGTYQLTVSKTDGSYTISAKVTDTDNNEASASEVTFNVGEIVNNPPTATISSPANGSTVYEGSQVVSITAADDNAVSSVEIYNGSTKLGNAALSSGDAKNGTWTYTFTAAVGSLSLKAVATDNESAVGNSAVVNVTVQEKQTGPWTFKAESIGSFSGLNAYLYKPTGVTNASVTKMVVAMHGCLETAEVYAGNTRWSTYAEDKKFLVLYPENPSGKGYNQCFDWYSSAAQNGSAGSSSAAVIAMINKVKETYPNVTEIYATGLSAGGALAAIMLAKYPTLFTKGSVQSGLPYAGYTGSAFSTLSYMAGTNADKSPSTWAGIMPTNPGTYPPILVFHGDADNTVKPLFLTEIMEQWTEVHGIDRTADNGGSKLKEGHSGHTYNEYHDAQGKVIVATVLIAGMGHGTAVDPEGTGADAGGSACGGNLGMCYAFDVGLNSTYYAAKFFGLLDGGDTPPLISTVSPSNGAEVTSNFTWTVNASDDKGVSKIEFRVNGGLVDTKTDGSQSTTVDISSYDNGTVLNLQATAFDTINQSTNSQIVQVTVKKNSPIPTVNVTSPINGAKVTGNVNINAVATDDVAVTKVEIYVNNELKATSSTYTLNTLDYGCGTTLKIKAIAYDADGNTATDDDTEIVTDHTKPIVTADKASGEYDGSVTVNLSVNEIANIYYTLDGSAPNTESMSGTSVTINTVGTTKLRVIAIDVAGNISEEITRDFVVKQDDVENPEVVITSPVETSFFGMTTPAQVQTNTLEIKGTASDDTEVQRVEVKIYEMAYLGGPETEVKSVTATGTTSWSYNLDTTTLNNFKYYVIKVKSIDKTGKESEVKSVRIYLMVL